MPLLGRDLMLNINVAYMKKANCDLKKTLTATLMKEDTGDKIRWRRRILVADPSSERDLFKPDGDNYRLGETDAGDNRSRA